ncbi:MAG: ATP-binding protein [Planctomycetota bacterium]
MSAYDNEDQAREGAGRRALLARLAGGLAHEIKNPLSTMSINLTLLEEDFLPAPGGAGEPTARERRALKRIATLQKEVARLEGILDDFLRFARGGDINRAPVDIVTVVREVLEFLAPEHEAAGIAVHAALPSKMPLVMLDVGAFKQGLMNLLVNARQAMPGGGELIVELRRNGPTVDLTITDTGVGMTPEQQAKCFDLYWSTKRGGTGLGLATTKRIIEKHDGSIVVESEPGRGTRFHMFLPLLQEIAKRPVEVVEQKLTAERGRDDGARDLPRDVEIER